MQKRRLCIAGTGSGVGKTTITIGLMAALKQKGYVVQGFKCGPDYIDPTYHTAVTGRHSRNLDGWMLDESILLDVLNRGSEGADISIIEGVMGFFDGKDPLANEGSTAQISELTHTPVLLVVNCASMARSAAAIVKGFQAFPHQAQIVGVIANKVGSKHHYELVKQAVETECGIPVVGYIVKDNELVMPERHLGLIPSVERGELTPFFEKLGEQVAATFDLDTIYELAKTEEVYPFAPSIFQASQIVREPVRVAVARDEAFNFYYPENLDLLESLGAELIYFSPVKGERLPDSVSGLYLGGGFPEEFAHLLARHTDMKASIRNGIENGMPTFAECGGFMFLTEAIRTSAGESYPMVGVIPGEVKMQSKLAALGYREIVGTTENPWLGEGMVARGHEFHYSTYQHSHIEPPYAYRTKGMRGWKQEGFVKGQLVAGYTHIHFASCIELVENWLQACRRFVYV